LSCLTCHTTRTIKFAKSTLRAPHDPTNTLWNQENVQASFDGAAEPTREGGNDDSETGRNSDSEQDRPPKKRRRDRQLKLNYGTQAQKPKREVSSGSSAKVAGLHWQYR
jgi:hypothetical protein